MAARCEGQELAAASTCEAARALSGPSSITAAQATAAGSMRIISRFTMQQNKRMPIIRYWHYICREEVPAGVRW
jgi:hypothetical protein